jgi:hypothetical protein
VNPSTISITTIVGLFGLLGLFVASRALDSGIYFFGFALFALAVFFQFWTIKRHFDDAEARLPLDIGQ